MALINPIEFVVSTSATATKGSKIINVTGNVNCAHVYAGTTVFIGDLAPVEAVSGTVPDADGNSTITLRYVWNRDTTTDPLIAYDTIEGLSEAIRRAREVIENVDSVDKKVQEHLVTLEGMITDIEDAAGHAAAAKASQEAAKVSETNSKTSETNSKTSETNAATSASNAASSATAASQDATQTGVDRAAAASSASEAATSETNAKDSENKAEASKNSAATSASAASTSATNSANSATAAKASEDNAADSEGEAKTSETNAANSASTASTKATEASSSATSANSSKVAAKTSETNAKTSETNAKASETTSGTNATTATNKAAEASTSASEAKASKDAAKVSQDAAKASQDDAATSKADAQDAASISTANSNFKGDWSDLSGSLSIPASVRHNDSIWMMIKNTTSVQTKEPASNSDTWAAIGTLGDTAPNADLLDQKDPHVYLAMSKAEFLANAEQRKREYAGSGFAEWGRHFPELSFREPINKGLWTSEDTPYILYTGRSLTDGVGSSRTPTPQILVDGVQHNVSHTFINAEQSQINFPPAPDGTKTYDSATGVVTEHASAAEAFEGLVTNGDFRNGSTGWTLGPAWSIANGKATRTGGTTNSNIRQTFNVVAGVTYELSYFREHTGGSTITNVYGDLREGNGVQTYAQANTTLSTTVTDTFTPTSSGPITFQIYGIGNFAGSISNISVMPVTESVITSRKDLVFLETWHEAISDKNVVFPLGNVQYGAGSFDGVDLDNYSQMGSIPTAYAAFGEWHTPTSSAIYGHLWDQLTEAEKRVFINNPDNNIYYDSDADKLIQVRYRVRVVEGLGDDWGVLNFSNEDTSVAMYAATRESLSQVGKSAILSQGKSATTDDIGLFNASAVFLPPIDSDSNEVGVAQSKDKSTFAIPIALVQRLNQGAYHPTYNPMGCARFDNGAGGSVNWYDGLAINNNSISRCFTGQKWGYIGSAGGSGRSDQYSFYDAIYAGQVEDLRLNANKLDVNQLREDAMRKAVAGEMRGKGKVPFTFTFPLKQSGTGLTSSGWVCFTTHPDFSVNFYKHPATKDIPKIAGLSGSGTPTIGGFKLDGVVYTFNEIRLHYSRTDLIYFKLTEGTLASTGKTTNLIFTRQDSYKSTSEFDSIPWVDIVGDPDRIAATFPNGVAGQWVPQVPDGSSKSFNLNRKNSGNAVQRTLTANDGATWSFVANQTIETISNTFTTSPASVLVMLLQYETNSNFTEPSNSSIVIGDVGDVYASQAHQAEYGNRLQTSLTGKVGKRSSGAFTQESLSVTKSTKYAPTGTLGWTGATGDEPKHASLNLDTPDNNSPAVKALSTITEKDGLLYLQLHGNGLEYNASSFLPWGDDSIIPIVNNEGTKTDLNGTTVKTFCHHTQIPLGIKSNN